MRAWFWFSLLLILPPAVAAAPILDLWTVDGSQTDQIIRAEVRSGRMWVDLQCQLNTGCPELTLKLNHSTGYWVNQTGKPNLMLSEAVPAGHISLELSSSSSQPIALARQMIIPRAGEGELADAPDALPALGASIESIPLINPIDCSQRKECSGRSLNASRNPNQQWNASFATVNETDIVRINASKGDIVGSWSALR